jgi:hypothetical protein
LALSDALLKKAIEIFNYPGEMGEYGHDEVASLKDMVAAARREGFQRVADLEILAEELAASQADTGDAVAPYSKARLAVGGLELYHSGRDAWIRAADREAMRAELPVATPDVKALRALWEKFDAGAPDVERRFDSGGSHLTHVAGRLLDAGDHALVNRIAARVLQDGTRFPGHWWNIVSASRLARHDLVAARAAIANALLYTESWSPRGLALMYQWFEASGAGAETLAIVYHGAAAWAFDIKGKDYLGWKSLPKPNRLKTRFAPIYAEWVRAVWPGVEAFDRGQLIHLRAMFEDLAGRALADLRRDIDAHLQLLDTQ